MTVERAPLLKRLSAADEPKNNNAWAAQDGYYVAACQASDEDIPGLLDLVRRSFELTVADDQREKEPHSPPPGSGVPQPELNEGMLAVTAWRTLADLKADMAVQPLLDAVCSLGPEFDDWAFEDLPFVFGKIGESSIVPLCRLAADKDQRGYFRAIAVAGLRRVAEFHAGARNRVVARLTEWLDQAVENTIDFNTQLLDALVELRAVEAAESIERAFSRNLIDIGWVGSWERVRQGLGIKGLGLSMPEHPHNALEEMGKALGMSVYSKSPSLVSDASAAQAHFQRADTNGPRTDSTASGNQHVGRNDPCPCKSGKKFKKCCGNLS